MVNLLELERLIWPTFSLITTFVSGVLFLIAMATPGWFRIDIYLTDKRIGNITLGLIQGRQVIERDSDLLVDTSFYTFERFNDILNLTSLYILLLCLILTIPLSLANMAFEFVNTYQVVKEWWRGPATIYVISLSIVAMAVLSAAVFTDFYTINLFDPIIKQQIINTTRADVNFERYTGTTSLQYSAYVFIVGACFSVIPLLLAWRLTVLLPIFYTTDVLRKNKYDVPEKFEMDEFEEDEDEEEDEGGEEEEEEEEDQFIMAERYVAENKDDENSSEEEEEESEDEREEDQIDGYVYPQRKPTVAGYLTYQQ